jgi:hypothetical protein
LSTTEQNKANLPPLGALTQQLRFLKVADYVGNNSAKVPKFLITLKSFWLVQMLAKRLRIVERLPTPRPTLLQKK